jgi:hypothetical protein
VADESLKSNAPVVLIRGCNTVVLTAIVDELLGAFRAASAP